MVPRGCRLLLCVLTCRPRVEARPPDIFMRPAARRSLKTNTFKSCKDERKACRKLGAELFAPNGECKYPAAERCRRTCGLCGRAELAGKCRTQVNDCAPLCASSIDWSKYFSDVLERPLAKEKGARLLSHVPFLLEVPKFLTPQEATTLIQLGARKVQPEDDLPKQVRDVAKYDCEDDSCLFHPLVGEIYRRVSELLGVGMENFESLEFLRYRKGQHYSPHEDAFPLEDVLERGDERGAGQRQMTVFFYLSDVEEGGETYFPNARPKKLRVKPEVGKIVVWNNVESDTWTVTPSSMHQAIPVKKGLKWSANFWVHATDVRAPRAFSHKC